MKPEVEEKAESRPGVPAVDSIDIEKHVEDAAQPPGRAGPQLQATLNLIPAHTWYANASGALTFLNERGSDYLGLAKDHPLRLGIHTGAGWDSHIPLLHPDDREETRRVWSNCLRTGCAGQVSFRVRNAEGVYRWFLSRAEPVRESDGTLLYWIGINLDIEDQKRAEEGLQRSQAYLAEAQRLTQTGSWAYEPARDELVHCSDELFRIYGFDREEGVPTLEHIRSRIHPEDCERVKQHRQKQFREKREYVEDYRVVLPDGRVRHLHIVGHPIHDKNGQLVEYVGTAMDITDRRRAEESLQRTQQDLQESKAKLEEAQRITHVGYWERDLVTDRITWSDETYRIFGLQPQEHPMDLVALREMIHPQDRQFVSRALDEALGGGARYNTEYRVLRPTGEVRIVHSTCDVKKDASGRPYQMFGTVQDITARKRAEEALQQSEFYLAEGQRLGHAGSWSFKPDLTCDYWSRELYEILGFDPNGGIPTISDYFTRVHPQDRPVAEATIHRMIAAGEGCDLKKRIIRPDGVQRVIRCVGMPVRENGVVTRFVGTLMDITEQEELTQELRRREAYLAEAQRLSHTGSFGWKISTSEVVWSDETFRILQYDRTLRPGVELFLQRVHPEDAARVKETIERASQDGQDFDFEHRLLMQDGSVKHVHIVARASIDELGRIEFVGAVMDVTAAKQVEDRIRLIINTVPGLHWSARPDGWVNFINQRWLDYTGMTLEQALGWGWTPAYHPDEIEEVLIAWRAAVAEGKPLEMETRLRRFDGEYRWFLERVFPLFDSAGHILGWYGSDIDIHERKLAEAKIREQEIELQQILQLTPQHVFVLRRDGSPIYANQGALEYFGLDADQLLAESRINFVHPDDREHFLAERQKGFLTGAPHQFEARLRRHDGTFRWFLSRRNPLKDERGQILRWYVAGIDIEDRKRTEEALKASEGYLAEAQKLSHTGSWAWSPADTDVRYWSEECYRVLGFDPRNGLPRIEELIQRIHPDDQAAFRESVRRATHGKLDEEVDYRIVHPGGAVRYIHSIGHPVFNAFGDLIEYTGTVIDVTERKRAEEAVRRSEAFLAEGQRLSHTGSWGWNAATGKLTWSQEHFRILGLDPNETNPALDVFWERVHPDDRIGLRGTFESAIRDKRDFEQEFRIITPDSSIKYLHGVGQAVLNKANELVEFIGSTMDITERKQAEAALQEARAELERVTRVTTMGELAASIAHEINQPLAGVVTSANAGLNWLAANPPNLSKTRETLERILRDGTRGGEVLARIRALLKRTPPAKTVVTVNQIVRDVLALTAGELRQHSIELSLELDSTLPAIRGDSIQLQQVLLNLIKNAIEAMAGISNRQRTLRIQSRLGELEGKPVVLVEVSDTGAGFSGSDGSRLFEAFHTTKPQGMGMGLWISRSIIENHHGRLTASPNDGPGATFVIMVPTENQGQA